jgi:3-oxoacyl-[acyl-carrier-protein] synthase II
MYFNVTRFTVTHTYIQTSTLPPTINYETPDTENGLDLNYVPNKAVTLDAVNGAMSDNLGFGGHNAAIYFKKMQ